jgi:hypothetical protein
MNQNRYQTIKSLFEFEFGTTKLVVKNSRIESSYYSVFKEQTALSRSKFK